MLYVCNYVLSLLIQTTAADGGVYIVDSSIDAGVTVYNG